MRTLHVITGLATGGAEMMLCKLLAELQRKGHQSEVISLTGGGPVAARLEELGIRVQRAGMRSPLGALSAVSVIRRSIRSFDPDVVQGWMYHGNVAATLGARNTGIPVCWNIRCTPGRSASWAGRLGFSVSRRLSTSPDLTLYNSQRALVEHGRAGFVSGRAEVIPNGFDASRFRPRPDARSSLRESLGLNAETPVVGHVARYHPVKDHATFVEAAAIVAKRMPTAHFILAGRGVDATNSALTQQLRAHGLDHRTHLLGEYAEVENLYPAFDVFVLSSRSEGFPNVVGEAMACGVPCVVTDVGDAAVLLGGIGSVLSVGDASGLARAMERVLSLSPGERATLAKDSRRRVEQEYALDVITDRYLDAYTSLIDARRPDPPRVVSRVQ